MKPGPRNFLFPFLPPPEECSKARGMSPIAEITSEHIAEAVDAMIQDILKKHRDNPEVVVVGIANGGIQLGTHIAQALTGHWGREVPFGVVDITFHRDDIGLQPISKISLPTELPFSIDDTTVILVDDVLYSGRTARAALNELFDQGRPAAIELCVLVHREATRLPIQPDYYGFRQKVDPDRKVTLDLEPGNLQSAQLTIR